MTIALPDDESFSLFFDTAVQMHARDASLSGMSYETLREELSKLRKKKERVIIVSPSRTRAKRLAESLTADDVVAYFRESPERPMEAGDIMTFAGRMRKGFSYPDLGFTKPAAMTAGSRSGTSRSCASAITWSTNTTGSAFTGASRRSK